MSKPFYTDHSTPHPVHQLRQRPHRPGTHHLQPQHVAVQVAEAGGARPGHVRGHDAAQLGLPDGEVHREEEPLVPGGQLQLLQRAAGAAAQRAWSGGQVGRRLQVKGKSG